MKQKSLDEEIRKIEETLEEGVKNADKNRLREKPIYYAEKTKIIADPKKEETEKDNYALFLRYFVIKQNKKGGLFIWALPYCKRMHGDEPFYIQPEPLKKITLDILRKKKKRARKKQVKDTITETLASICERYNRKIMLTNNRFAKENKAIIDGIYKSINKAILNYKK